MILIVPRTAHLPLPEYQYWLDALMRDDYQFVDDALSSYGKCDVTDRKKHFQLLDGQFVFPELSGVQKKIVSRSSRRLTHPITVAAAHRAVGVVGVLLGYGVDIFVKEADGNNLIHCLIDAAAMWPDRELDIINVYELLRQRQSVSDLAALLKSENGSSFKMRPLEYAARCGTLQLMFALWETRGVYIIREELVDVSVYQWYDVTEYIGLEQECRISVSPLYLIAELNEDQLTTSFAREMFVDGLIADWIKITHIVDAPILKLFFGLRIVFVSVFAAYEMDESTLRRFGGISSTDVPPFNASNPNNTFEFCNNAGAFNYPTYLTMFMTVYLIFYSAFVIFYDATSIIQNIRTNFPRYRRFLSSEYSGAKTRYVNMGFAGLVLFEIYLLNTVTERGTGTILIDMVRLAATAASLFSVLYFMRMIPGVGHMFIYMQKTSTDLALFGGAMFCVIFLFCRLEMLFVNTNSLTGCTPEFANIFISYYTVFLTFLNMQDYTQFSVISQGLLYMQHIVFVFVVGIMLYNLLIAISNDTVNHVYRDKDVMTSLGRLFATMEINTNIRHVPRIGKLYVKYFYKKRVLNNFVCENGRVFLVRIKSSNARLLKK